MEQVTDRIFAETKVRGCNPCFVKTSKGPVVIDTPQLPTKAVAMRDMVEAIGPIQYLINTEHHVDHIFGNYWFKGRDDDRPPPGRPRAVHDRLPGAGPVRVRPRGAPDGRPGRRRPGPRPRDLLREHGHGGHRVHGRPDPQGGRPDVPPAPHARPHAGPGRGLRPGGARRLHRRHDLLGVHDLADDLRRGPVDHRARPDPRARHRPRDPGPRPRPDEGLPGHPALVHARVEGRRRGRRSRRAGRARRPSRGSASRSATRSISGRNT